MLHRPWFRVTALVGLALLLVALVLVGRPHGPLAIAQDEEGNAKEEGGGGKASPKAGGAPTGAPPGGGPGAMPGAMPGMMPGMMPGGGGGATPAAAPAAPPKPSLPPGITAPEPGATKVEVKPPTAPQAANPVALDPAKVGPVVKLVEYAWHEGAPTPFTLRQPVTQETKDAFNGVVEIARRTRGMGHYYAPLRDEASAVSIGEFLAAFQAEYSKAPVLGLIAVAEDPTKEWQPYFWRTALAILTDPDKVKQLDVVADNDATKGSVKSDLARLRECLNDIRDITNYGLTRAGHPKARLRHMRHLLVTRFGPNGAGSIPQEVTVTQLDNPAWDLVYDEIAEAVSSHHYDAAELPLSVLNARYNKRDPVVRAMCDGRLFAGRLLWWNADRQRNALHDGGFPKAFLLDFERVGGDPDLNHYGLRARRWQKVHDTLARLHNTPLATQKDHAVLAAWLKAHERPEQILPEGLITQVHERWAVMRSLTGEPPGGPGWPVGVQVPGAGQTWVRDEYEAGVREAMQTMMQQYSLGGVQEAGQAMRGGGGGAGGRGGGPGGMMGGPGGMGMGAGPGAGGRPGGGAPTPGAMGPMGGPGRPG